MKIILRADCSRLPLIKNPSSPLNSLPSFIFLQRQQQHHHCHVMEIVHLFMNLFPAWSWLKSVIYEGKLMNGRQRGCFMTFLKLTSCELQYLIDKLGVEKRRRRLVWLLVALDDDYVIVDLDQEEEVWEFF